MIAGPAPKVSLVIPVYNEASNLPLLFERLFAVLDRLELTFEVLLVDDGSTDGSGEALRQARADRPEVRVLTLTRNFGQHAAVLAGFEGARGEWIITLDADLQNPPEEIPRLIETLRRGHDLVHTVREGRQDNLFRRLASRLNGWVTRRLSGVELHDFGCMLRGYHRSVVEPILGRHEFRAYIPALASFFARRPTEISVAHAPRAAGESKYSLRKLLHLQLDLMTTFSVTPLRLLFTLGLGIALLSVLFGLIILVLRLMHGPEWAGEGVFTLFAVLFFLVGAQFIAFGLLGEYIGRICLEVRRRPAYLLREEDDARVRTGEPAAISQRGVPAERPR